MTMPDGSADYHTLLPPHTIPPDYLANIAINGDLLKYDFWKIHLPNSVAKTYCKYLTLETKFSRNARERKGA